MPLRFNQLVRRKKYKANLKKNVKKVMQSIISNKAHYRISNPGESTKGNFTLYTLGCQINEYTRLFGTQETWRKKQTQRQTKVFNKNPPYSHVPNKRVLA